MRVFRKEGFQKSSNLHLRLIKAIIVLPGTALVFIPVLILTLTKNSDSSYQFATPDQIIFWLALLPAGVGLGLAVKQMFRAGSLGCSLGIRETNKH